MKTNSIFKNDLYNKQFNENGYVVLDWIDANKVKELRDFTKLKGINNEKGFSNSMNNLDLESNHIADNLIKNIYNPQIAKYLKNVKNVIGSYAIKGPGKAGKISIHQDWSFVDEEKSFSINIWCALEDISYKNGCMAVLEKSHKQDFTIRGSLINKLWSIKRTTDIHKYWLKNFKIKYIPLKAGQALIYNQKIVHFSTENLSKKSRIAAGLIMTPKNTDLIHYSFENNNEFISKYIIDSSFYFLKKIESVSFNNYSIIETIKTTQTKDFVFDQAECKVYPDQMGIKNKIKKLLYKL